MIEGFGFGIPCHHPGCDRHISHPCEVCGRVGAKWTVLEMYALIGDQARQLAAAEARAAELTSMLHAREAQRDEEHQRGERLARMLRAERALQAHNDRPFFISNSWPETIECDAARAALRPGDMGEEGGQ